MRSLFDMGLDSSPWQRSVSSPWRPASRLGQPVEWAEMDLEEARSFRDRWEEDFYQCAFHVPEGIKQKVRDFIAEKESGELPAPATLKLETSEVTAITNFVRCEKEEAEKRAAQAEAEYVAPTKEIFGINPTLFWGGVAVLGVGTLFLIFRK